jgi:hypothetical protein
MQGDQLTPFLETMLSIVRETCGPSGNWELNLCERLRQRYYHDASPEPGKPVEAQHTMAIHARLLEVEIRLSATAANPSTNLRGKDITNYDPQNS